MSLGSIQLFSSEYWNSRKLPSDEDPYGDKKPENEVIRLRLCLLIFHNNSFQECISSLQDFAFDGKRSTMGGEIVCSLPHFLSPHFLSPIYGSQRSTSERTTGGMTCPDCCLVDVDERTSWGDVFGSLRSSAGSRWVICVVQ